MKLLNFISILFLTFPLIGQEVFYSESNLFPIDTKEPQVELSYPNGGEELIPGDSISVQWNAVDDNFGELPISLLISTEAGGSFDILTAALPNLGMAPLNMPQINSAYCLLKIEAIDFFGNTAYDESDSFFSIGSDDEGEIIDTLLTAYSESNLFIIDTQDPQVEIIYPNGGEELNAGEGITYLWSAEDGNLGDTPISLALSTAAGGTFETFAQDLVNDGLEESVLPDINSTYCLLQVVAIDIFGNTALDESDVFFSIGSEQDGEVVDTLLFAFSESDNFPIDTRDPEITILYPNGGEQLLDYAQTEIAWLAEDDNLDEGSLAAYIAFELGGWFLTAASDLENAGSAVVDLSVGGVVPERLWGMLKMTATDAFGNSGLDYSDDYFILGDPEGTMETESVDIMTSLNLLDWSWQSDQLFTFRPASLSFLNDGDELVIVDDNGIVNSSCEGDIGPLDLVSFIFNSDMAYSYVSLKTYQGADYCDLGGVRYSGYVLGNDIVYQARYANGSTLELIPDIDTGGSVFNDSMVVINSFENVTYPGCIYGTVEDCSGDGDCCFETWIGDGIADCEEQARGCDLSCYMEDAGDCTDPGAMLHIPHEDIFIYIANDRGRDFNDYNIYRSVKHSIELARDESDCTGTCGTCSDNLTFEQDDCIAHGVCDYYPGDPSDQITEEECCIQFDIDICAQDLANWTPYTWTDKEEEYNEELDECTCLIIEHINQDWYFDSFSMSQNQWCYQVYLMDGDTKLVNTVQSCNDVESYYNYTTGDFNFDSVVNVLDILILSTHILEINVISSDFIIFLMDVNSDDTLNILDIMVVMNIILSEAE